MEDIYLPLKILFSGRHGKEQQNNQKGVLRSVQENHFNYILLKNESDWMSLIQAGTNVNQNKYNYFLKAKYCWLRSLLYYAKMNIESCRISR